jgi:altronate hydrolase
MNGVVVAGNQAGGIANIFEKSLGSAMKGGTTPLQAVYEYAEPITEHGFVFMDSPGYDPCSATGQIASGANMICFTTGRGSMFGASRCRRSSWRATRRCTSARGRHGHQLRRRLDGERRSSRWASDLRADPARRLGREDEERVLGLGDNEFVPWQLGIVTERRLKIDRPEPDPRRPDPRAATSSAALVRRGRRRASP